MSDTGSGLSATIYNSSMILLYQVSDTGSGLSLLLGTAILYLYVLENVRVSHITMRSVTLNFDGLTTWSYNGFLIILSYFVLFEVYRGVVCVAVVG